MSSSNRPRTICLPAHILDAHISPRAREVLMLLASQTTMEHPAVWVCHAAIAERLRCSPVTVKRAIQKLVEAKLIVETGDLHERRYKFYRVRWSLNEKPISKAAPVKKTKPVPVKVEPRKLVEESISLEGAEPIAPLTPTERVMPARPPTIEPSPLPKDSLFAQYYERARQKHQEYLRRYQIDPVSFNKPDLPRWNNQDNSPAGL